MAQKMRLCIFLPILLVVGLGNLVPGSKAASSTFWEEHRELANDVADLVHTALDQINPFSYWTRKPTERPHPPSPAPAPEPPQPEPQPQPPAPQPEPEPQPPAPQPEPEPQPPAPQPGPEPQPQPPAPEEPVPGEGEFEFEGLDIDSKEYLGPHKLLNNKLAILGGKRKHGIILPKNAG